MPNGHGGYRRPSNPAPVSGPGRLSQRTDGMQPTRALPDAKYGEGQAFEAAQQAAPMSETAGGNQAGMVGADLSQVVPFGAPSEFADEDIMAGMPMGEGPGSIMPPEQPTLTPEQANKLRSYLPTLIQLSSREDAGPSTRQFVRQLRAELG